MAQVAVEDTDVSEEVTVVRSRTPRQEAIPMLSRDAANETEWIKANICKRVCTRYVRANKQAANSGRANSVLDDSCECGHTKEEHSATAAATAKANMHRGNDCWSAQWDTAAEPTDAFGEIDFIDTSRKVAKFVRIDEQTSVEKIRHLLFRSWKLGKPTLVLSVLGNVSQAKPRVVQAIRRGLMKVMRSGAWTVTDGVRKGVMKMVGDAANTTMSDTGRAVCIGVVRWGVVANRSQLVLRDRERRPDPGLRYTVDTAEQGEPLEPNHTHFLLVDDGTARRCTQTTMRSKLEDMLSNLTHDAVECDAPKDCAFDLDLAALGGSLQVPLCSLLVGGDTHCLLAVRNCLLKHSPLVVVAGSGGLADLIAYTVERAQTNDADSDLLSNRTSVHSNASWRTSEKSEVELLKWLQTDTSQNADETAELLANVRTLAAERSHLVHVYDARGQLESARTLDDCVLLAILRSGTLDDRQTLKINQLALALQWDRSDIALNEIFTNDFKMRTNVVAPLFSTAVVQDKPMFVHLLLEQGFSLHEYLTVEILTALYSQCDNDTPFAVALNSQAPRSKEHGKMKQQSLFSLTDVGRAITNLCGAMYYSSYQHDPALCNVSYRTLLVSEEQHLQLLKQQNKRKRNAAVASVAVNADYSLGDPALHLFLYAVLMNRKELAMIFWKELTQNLASSLAASFLFGKLIKYASDRDMREEASSNAAYFGELAVGVLDACYSADQDHTHLHLLRQLREFAGATCLDLAETAGNMTFIAHPACKTLLHSVWRGELRQDHSTIKLLLCSFLPPLIPLLIRFQPQPMPRVLSQIAPPTLPTDVRNDAANEICVRPPAPVPSVSLCKPVERILQFYASPQVTFLTDVVSYVLFLILFSIMVLGEFVDDCEADMTALEWTVVVWMLCLFFEELRQLNSEPGTVSHKFVCYIRNPWNQLDVVSITFLIVAEILAGTTKLCYASLPYIRVLVGISIFIFYSRLLQFFSANKHIGPKLVMIFRMLKDVIIVMSILVVIVLGFTVVVVSVTLADQPLSIGSFTGGLSQVYWSMFGSAPVSTFSNITQVPIIDIINDTAVVTGYIDDPIGGYYLVMFLGFFVILTNLLLFNVLIAMFNYTFSVVQEKADEFWCYQSYKLITEYHARPPFPPPLLLLYHVWLIVRYIFGKLRGLLTNDDRVVLLVKTEYCRIKCDESVERLLISWEDTVVDEYLESLEEKKKATVERQVESVRDHTATIKDVVQYVANTIDSVGKHSNPSHLINFGQRLTKLEAKTEEIDKNVKLILELLSEQRQ